MEITNSLEIYDAAVAHCPKFERKGKSVPHTAANGYMFSLINKEGEFGIRFSKDVQEKYIAEFNTGVLMSHGAVMKGYVRISAELMKDEKRMVSLLNESFEYVMSLPPK